ncbi:hypothetical protein GYMLUDRAFT_413999 [Collybiopsis luxurians FD-317 M1]|nr:hypothetical protein GYMLUDRAFT_413999 [Collybiopsis luxurians FD-317 M1]
MNKQVKMALAEPLSDGNGSSGLEEEEVYEPGDAEEDANESDCYDDKFNSPGRKRKRATITSTPANPRGQSAAQPTPWWIGLLTLLIVIDADSKLDRLSLLKNRPQMRKVCGNVTDKSQGRKSRAEYLSDRKSPRGDGGDLCYQRYRGLVEPSHRGN